MIGPQVLSLLVETAVVVAAWGWFYVAIIGVVRPNDLPLPIVSWIPVRRDTFGISCFGLSATAFFISRLLRQPGTSRSVLRALLGTLFVYSTVTVVYLMVGTVTHPETLTMALTHLVGWPTEQFTLMLALVASLCSFVLLRASTRLSRSSDDVHEVGPR